MMRAIKIMVPLIMLMSLLSGCWDMVEIQNSNYLMALGIDYEDGRYIVYGTVLSFTNVAKQENGLPTKEAPVWIGRGEGELLNTAMFDLYTASQQRLYWGHITALVLSERVLQNDMRQVFEAMSTYSEFRSNLWVFGTKESIIDIFSTTPFFNLSPLSSILHEPQEIYRQMSIISPKYYYKLMLDYTERGQTVLLPSITATSKEWMKDRKKIPQLMINGAFFMNRGEYRGWIPQEDLIGVRWLESQTVRTPLALFKDNKPIVGLVMTRPKSKIKATIKDNKPIYEIEVSVTSNVEQMVETVPEKKIEKEVAKIIENEIRKTYEEGLKIKADVYGLGLQLYRTDPKGWYNVYEQTGDREFLLDEDSLSSINVHVKIIFSGKEKFRGGYNPSKK